MKAHTTVPPEAAAALLRRHRFRPVEALPWIVIALVYFLLPKSLALGTQVLIMVMFALSLDLLQGYAGITSLGHAVFFGTGAYAAGILTIHGVTEPLTGLLFSLVLCGALGLISGVVILRTHGLALLMLTLGILLMGAEFANRAAWLTGGADGLQGMEVGAIMGLIEFDFRSRVAYVYAVIVLVIVFVLVRYMVYSPYGRSLFGMQQNIHRMSAIGAPVRSRLVAAYGISAAIAGVAGAVNAQVNAFVGPNVLTLELSAGVLTMLIFGGVGRLYGSFVGAAFYMIMHDYLARVDPTYWYLWLGVLLIAVVMYSKGGILGMTDKLLAWGAHKS